MVIKTGYLDKSGHPNIKVSVYGISDQLSQEFEAMIDTGFTGFLMLPLVSAFPLGLTLMGTTNYTLADGSSSSKLLAIGTVVYEGEKSHGVIVLESKGGSPLLGMDFLRNCNKALLVSKSGVLLVDESDIVAAAKLAAEVQAKKQAAAAPLPEAPHQPPPGEAE
jgi:predicted aspartyl protease